MKRIPLTRGMFALVDDADYDSMMVHKWSARWGKSSWYASSNVTVNGQRKGIEMHRLLLGVTDPKTHVDHIDSDGLNNQRTNIRLASNAQNQHNARVARKNNTSGFKGVYWNRIGRTWKAQIKIQRRMTHLGTFRDKLEAARAYDAAAIKHFGAFARVNFPRAGS